MFTNVDYSSAGLSRICADAHAGTDPGKRLLAALKDLSEEDTVSLPEPNVVFELADDEFVALLAWKRQRVAVVEQDEYEHLLDVLDTDSPKLSGWRLLLAGDASLPTLLEALKEE